MKRRLLLQTMGAMPFAFALGAPRETRLPISLEGRIMPTFQNGYLGLIESDRRTVQVIDSEGRLVMPPCYIAVPDSSVSIVHAVAVSSQKTIAVAAAAKDGDGRLVSVLVFADFSGNITRLVRTTPFAAGRIVFLSDGRLMCVGREHDDQFEDVSGHNILRFYSSEGLLISKALSINLLRTNRRESHPLNWLIATGGDRVGMLDKETLRYAEVLLNGSLARPLSGLGIDTPAQVNGVALLSNSDRLVSVQRQSDSILYRLTDGQNNQIMQRVVTSIKAPDGTNGLIVLGSHNGQVVFMSMPDRLVFERETSL